MTGRQGGWAIAFVLAVGAGGAHGHGSGLVDCDCRNDSDSGRYDCHQGTLGGRSFTSEAAAEAAAAGVSRGEGRETPR